jgi:hypothetical protein
MAEDPEGAGHPQGAAAVIVDHQIPFPDPIGLGELINRVLTISVDVTNVRLRQKRTRIAYCPTEAEAGSDLSNVRTTARELTPVKQRQFEQNLGNARVFALRQNRTFRRS